MDLLFLLGLKFILDFFSMFKPKDTISPTNTTDTEAAFWFGTSYENMNSGTIEGNSESSDFNDIW